MRTRILLCALLGAAIGRPQCTLTNQSSCPADSNTPHLSDFLRNLNANLTATASTIATLTKSPVTPAALVLPATVDWMPYALNTYGPAINGYMDSLAAAGITDQEVNLWLGPLVAAAEYSPTGSQTVVPSDCAGGVSLAFGATPPVGSGPYCTALALYDSMFQHAAASMPPVTLRIIGFKPSTDMLTACGNLSQPTEAQYENCVLPMAVAAVKRWSSGGRSYFTDWQVVGEPLGGLAGVLNEYLSVADIGTFIVHTAQALSAVNTNLKLGAAASALSFCTGGSWCTLSNSDINYWRDWIGTASVTSAHNYLQYVVLDVFASNCDLSGGVPGSTPYAGELATVAANYITPAINQGYEVRIGQSQHPTYCPTGGQAGEDNAFTGYGAGANFWLSSGVQDTWAAMLRAWASAYGVSMLTVYCSGPFVWYTSSTTRTLCTGNYAADLMTHLPSTSASGTAFGAMSHASPGLQASTPNIRVTKNVTWH
jgi:hypothetical protein